MITVAHMMVGGAAGSLTGEPAAALALGIASHLPLDALPHFDLPDYRQDVAIAAVVAAGVLAAFGLRGGVPGNVVWGMVGGVLPDVENLLWHMGYLKEEHRFFPSHRRGWLKHGPVRGPANLGIQAALSVAALLVLFR